MQMVNLVIDDDHAKTVDNIHIVLDKYQTIFSVDPEIIIPDF